MSVPVQSLLSASLLLGLGGPGARAAELLSGTVSVGVAPEGTAPKGVGHRFPPDQRELHAVVDLDGLRVGATVKGAWIAGSPCTPRSARTC